MSAAEKLWPEVMDLTTAAAYLNVHPVTLREWKRLGKGPPGRKMEGRQVDSQYLEALGLPTAPSQRNGRRGSTPNTTE
jgi:hypothetical protein